MNILLKLLQIKCLSLFISLFSGSLWSSIPKNLSNSLVISVCSFLVIRCAVRDVQIVYVCGSVRWERVAEINQDLSKIVNPRFLSAGFIMMLWLCLSVLISLRMNLSIGLTDVLGVWVSVLSIEVLKLPIFSSNSSGISSG